MKKAIKLNPTIMLLLALSLPFNCIAAYITGRVVGVADGDTITILDSGFHQTKIRLAQIDAPEKSQDFGQRSKQSLSDLVYSKTVRVEVETVDRYHRTVGKVVVDDVDANLEQIKRGMAWVYKQYARDPAYFAAEDSARKAGVGLWSQPNPTPPWVFRHPNRMQAEPKSASTNAAPSSQCGQKHTCREMTNCAEARHYLNVCGVKSLDGNGDGVPCNALCR